MLLIAATLWAVLPGGLDRPDGTFPVARAQGPAPRPGVMAPAPLVAEFQAVLARALRQFEAKDLAGVLGHVSEAYRTGPLTKPTLRSQLLAIFQLYDAVKARVAIDDVRLVGEHAWIYSTGEIQGRLPFLGRWMTVLWWERELEVARREDGGWRLYGYQQ